MASRGLADHNVQGGYTMATRYASIRTGAVIGAVRDINVYGETMKQFSYKGVLHNVRPDVFTGRFAEFSPISQMALRKAEGVRNTLAKMGLV